MSPGYLDFIAAARAELQPVLERAGFTLKGTQAPFRDEGGAISFERLAPRPVEFRLERYPFGMSDNYSLGAVITYERSILFGLVGIGKQSNLTAFCTENQLPALPSSVVSEADIPHEVARMAAYIKEKLPAFLAIWDGGSRPMTK